MSTPVRSIVTAALLAATVIPASRVAHGQITPQKDKPVHTAAFPIPESLRREHEEIHHRLEDATRAPGAVGEAARALAEVLHPHFVREEQIALPPLALLAPLARGETSAEMREVLPMTDSLRAELPRMLEEHKAIRAATLRMGETARTAGNAEVAALADALALHAQSEEELFYPAAIVVGDLVRARMAAAASR
ncbi:MAG TPA: hemerythrin domain-containing protein [Gemmatimonadaceae bacterium]|nr:hemerythrin domain-containing protein [Gemmatimonadaceae bacterium]